MRNLISRTGLVFAIALCMTVACWAQAQTGTSQQGTYSTTNQTPAATAFLKKAMEANEAQIELGRLAQTRAQDQRVKDFANLMVTDHTQMLNRLHDAMGTSTSSTHHKNKQTGTSSSTGSMQLSKEDQQTKNRLSKLSGPAFDRAYMDAMVQDHRKDVREFEMEAGMAPGSTSSSTSDTSTDQTASREKPGMNANENSAQAIAREQLPTLKKHLKEAEEIQRELAQTR